MKTEHGVVLFSVTGAVALFLALAALFLVAIELNRLDDLSSTNCIRDNATRTAERRLWQKQIPPARLAEPAVQRFLYDLNHDLADHPCK